MYVLILRRNQDHELPVSMDEMGQRFGAWTGALQNRGVLKAVERFKPATEAVTLRQADGQLGTEGRYTASEDVIGYYVLDTTDMDVARALAADCPILEAGGSVEIRETEAFGPPPSSD